jgi:hypothetical protein
VALDLVTAMRYQRRSFLYPFYVLGALAFQMVAHDIHAGEEERLKLVGRVSMEAVDSRRILIAVATRSDGSAEHLFLYTASTPLRVSPNLRNVYAAVDYDSGNGLRVTPTLADQHTFEFVLTPTFESRAPDVIRFKDPTGLSHYLANPPLRIEDLNALHKTRDCDQSPRACIDVAGQFLPFPG